ncbi:MAG: hypothetical protein HYS08_04355 [Chlamydiae bacterium]|nr:hypothetical protein [Chlamydiota bacterium]MBI3266150.1 hypothetical protein [Chlamydiota bacterium]
MKPGSLIFNIIFYLFLLLLLQDPIYAEDLSFLGHAFIEYKLTGKNEGSEELYIKNNKIRSITRLNTSVHTSTIVIDLLYMIEGSDIILVDFNQREGSRIKNSFDKSVSEMTDEEKRIFKREILTGLPRQSEFEDLGRETILGKDCLILKAQLKEITMKIWIWNDLVLKSEMTGSITFSKVATQIDTSSPISKDLFQVPLDIKIKEKMTNNP